MFKYKVRTRGSLLWHKVIYSAVGRTCGLFEKWCNRIWAVCFERLPALSRVPDLLQETWKKCKMSSLPSPRIRTHLPFLPDDSSLLVEINAMLLRAVFWRVVAGFCLPHFPVGVVTKPNCHYLLVYTWYQGSWPMKLLPPNLFWLYFVLSCPAVLVSCKHSFINPEVEFLIYI